MSLKCIKISICVSFLIFSVGLMAVSLLFGAYPPIYLYDPQEDEKQLKLTYSNRSKVYCPFKDMSGSSFLPLKTPSLESLIRASSTVENPELRLSGLAVFSNLSDACQPPVDVSKSNIHVNKIALITVIANKAECSLQDLTVNAQDAGYSVVLYGIMQTEVVVEISVSQKTDDLKRMQKYLERLYYWFLLGPLITLEWLRRTKKFCCMSGGQRVHEDERSTEDEETVDETSLHAVVVETQEQFDQETEHEQSTGEEQPLIIAVNDPRANRTTMGHTGCLAKRLSWHFSQNCCWLWLRDSHRSSSPGRYIQWRMVFFSIRCKRGRSTKIFRGGPL
ncbi:uncharacterized protein LOC144647525 [Oculina patagonica]